MRFNTNAKITCDFADERFRNAAAGLEKDIFVRNHLHAARLVVRLCCSAQLCDVAFGRNPYFHAM